MTQAFAIVRDYCKTRGYPVPVAEHRFHPTRKWRFDAAFPSAMVAVEFQGGAWTGGRHTRGKGFEADCEKLSTAASMGWRVLPVTYRHVNGGELFAWLDQVFGETNGGQ